MIPHRLRLTLGGVVGRCGLLPLVAFTFGCADSQSKVSGQIMYQGKPVPGGWISFQPADSRKNSISTALDAQGKYEALLPTGVVRIAVDNRELEPMERGSEKLILPPGLKLPAGVKPPVEPAAKAPNAAPPASSGAYVAIPAKYYDIDTSGLTYTVQSGTQTHNIELK